MKDHCFITGKSDSIIAFVDKTDPIDSDICIAVNCEEKESLLCNTVDINDNTEL